MAKSFYKIKTAFLAIVLVLGLVVASGPLVQAEPYGSGSYGECNFNEGCSEEDSAGGSDSDSSSDGTDTQTTDTTATASQDDTDKQDTDDTGSENEPVGTSDESTNNGSDTITKTNVALGWPVFVFGGLAALGVLLFIIGLLRRKL